MDNSRDYNDGASEIPGPARVAGRHRREYIVVIHPNENGLTLHTIPEYGATDHVQVRPQEVELAEQLVKKLAAPFHPERYEVIDLMQALRKSLSDVAAKKPEAHAKPASRVQKPRRRAS